MPPSSPEKGLPTISKESPIDQFPEYINPHVSLIFHLLLQPDLCDVRFRAAKIVGNTSSHSVKATAWIIN